MTAEPKLKEIATRIGEHLRRFEADPKINVEIRPGSMTAKGPTRYFWPRAFVAGPKVGVIYVSYQRAFKLSKAEALKYLEWLDAGNVGKHFEALRG